MHVLPVEEEIPQLCCATILVSGGILITGRTSKTNGKVKSVHDITPDCLAPHNLRS